MTRKKEKNDWKKLGVVAVDSGQLIVSDPCYIDRHWKKYPLQTYESMLAQVEDGEMSYGGCCKATVSKEFGQLRFPGVKKGGAGVTFSTGFGDGVYGVYGRFKTFKKLGKRLVEVRMVFVEDE